MNATTALTARPGGDLDSMSDEELFDELRSNLTLTATHIARAAQAWWLLENRGHDLSKLRTGMSQYLSAVALGRLVPEAVVRLAGNGTAIRALTHLSLDQQREVLTRGSVSVVRSNGSAVDVPVQSLTAADIARAFDPTTGSLVPPGQQKQPRQIRARAPRMKRIVVELTDEQHTRLQTEAAKSGRSASALVLQCLKNEGAI
jgi:hypothetical protein